MNRIRVGIAGGAGYTAGELIRILIRHPDVDLCFVQSESYAGKLISDIHDDLYGSSELIFSDKTDLKIDVLFLCKGHGESSKFLSLSNLSQATKIIDLSQDFRIDGSEPDLQKQFGVFEYGLSEFQPEKISQSKNIANPGCFATCIQLGLLPLASNGLLSSDVHVSAITGSTGAGQKPTDTQHFSWRNNNISNYKPFKHQHLNEIYQTLKKLQPNFKDKVNFIPYRGNFTRGILATMYLKSDIHIAEAFDLFKSYYSKSHFVKISYKNVHLKQVVNTNNCFLYLEKIEDNLMIVSVIDNLLKGASGQAVQNMNLMSGLKENIGLELKATSF